MYVQRVKDILTEEFINPFSNEMDKTKLYSITSGTYNDNDDNDNEFISAYPFQMKLALRPKIIYTKKKYCIMRYREIIS